ncbi:squalene-hopene cyclase [Sphingobium sp. Ant17]|nr:squalene-hopene cyclase [Sphingobium sp. Ant17]
MIARGDAVPTKKSAWNGTAAAAYLDNRLTWWRQWPKAERDHGTRCVSCHTSLPHVLAMPSLRSQSGKQRQSVDEMGMFDDVVKRVYLWDEVEPFYPDQTRGVPKSAESRGVEAVLNALILATRDQERGHLGPDTRQAFAHMWGVQMKAGDQKGGFTWLNFRLEPFESPTATYWGATLAALAVARAPDGYAADPAVAPQVDALRAYLRTGIGGSLYSRALILWADSQLGGVLPPDQRSKVISDLVASQRADGGWNLPSLSTWQRIDGSNLPQESDGYATAIVAVILREVGGPTGAVALKQAQAWLAAHQGQDGAVAARSINKDRKPGTDAYLFMTDEATGMAALAMRR